MTPDVKQQALTAIRNRRDALLRERAELQQRRKDIDQRDRMIDRELADCVAAARVFGDHLELPEDEPKRDLYWKSSNLLSRWISQYDSQRPLHEKKAKLTNPPMPKVKDIVLDRLKAAGEGGTKAAPIRDYIVETYGERIHEKTVGMTLYRLSKEGLAHRKGITWFFGPPHADTKNPGVAAPGSASISD